MAGIPECRDVSEPQHVTAVQCCIVQGTVFGQWRC